MSLILAKIALVVLMSHVLRQISLHAGPRWGGLALGLPVTSAIALAGCGQEYGASFAVVMAGHGLIGVAGSVAVPLGFAWAIQHGLDQAGCLAASILAYLMAVLVAGGLGALLPGGDILVACLAVSLGSNLALRLGSSVAMKPSEKRLESGSHRAWLRSVVPIVCLLAVQAACRLSGAEASGMVGIFPGLSLTLLILTVRESGPTEAIRIARALPMGNLGMVAFLTFFRLTASEAGLGFGLLIGYLAAIVVLGILASQQGPGISLLALLDRRKAIGPSHHHWPKPGRTFSPYVELIAR